MSKYENCANCGRSEYDEEAGKYVCNAFHQLVYILLDSEECPRYEERVEEIINNKKE